MAFSLAKSIVTCLVEGQQVKIVNSLAGNLIIQVKDSRIALDRGLCSRILVNE